MIRRAIAVIVCSAAMLAYWLGFGSIVRGNAFGVPFGWAFGSAAFAAVFATPLMFDRDDPTLIAGKTGPFALIAIIAAATNFGAGIVLHGSREYWIGGALGAAIGGALSYWAFGQDRADRGVPRVSGPEKGHSAIPPALPRQ